MSTTVAIPRALLYYQYYPKWKTFFEELGARVITSGETKRLTLAQGSARVVAETCLPTKVFCGHVIELAGQADYVFIPSIRSLETQVYNCSKFLGLPDLVRGVVKDGPPVLDIEIDVNKGPKKVKEEIQSLGRRFTRSSSAINAAYEKALSVDERYLRMMREERLTPPEAIARLYGTEDGDGGRDVGTPGPVHSSGSLTPPASSGQALAFSQREPGTGLKGLTVAVVGHPYNIYDTHINHDLIGRLRSLGVTVLTAEMAAEAALDEGTARLIGKPYWTYEDEVVGAAGHYFDSEVDGLICVVCFGCGPDSLMMDVIRRHGKTRPGKPLMTLIIDEHSGEAGLVTRIEAFVDMLYRRRARAAS
jgi:predicted nucleotide-binding protein (sugar kinase/HSP70/actin superfamily)